VNSSEVNMPGIGEALNRNVRDIQSVAFWKAIVAEVLGTLILVFCGCAVCLGDWEDPGNIKSVKDSSFVQISLTFGLAVATPVWCIAHVSGGHINPAVTIAMLVTRKITIVRALFYVIAQCAGAVAGAGLLYGVHPPDIQSRLGCTYIGWTNVTETEKGVTIAVDKISPGQGFLLELLITFVLVFTVFASCDKGRTDLGGSIPLTIGLSVTLCHLFAIKYTGSSMNPARSFGPAVIMNYWKQHYIYWFGPISGGIIAGLLYEWVFSVDSSVSKIKSHFTPAGHGQYTPAPADDKPLQRTAKV